MKILPILLLGGGAYWLYTEYEKSVKQSVMPSNSVMPVPAPVTSAIPVPVQQQVIPAGPVTPVLVLPVDVHTLPIASNLIPSGSTLMPVNTMPLAPIPQVQQPAVQIPQNTNDAMYLMEQNGDYKNFNNTASFSGIRKKM